MRGLALLTCMLLLVTTTALADDPEMGTCDIQTDGPIGDCAPNDCQPPFTIQRAADYVVSCLEG